MQWKLEFILKGNILHFSLYMWISSLVKYTKFFIFFQRIIARLKMCYISFETLWMLNIFLTPLLFLIKFKCRFTYLPQDIWRYTVFLKYHIMIRWKGLNNTCHALAILRHTCSTFPVRFFFCRQKRGVCFYPFSQVTGGASRTTCPDKHANDMQMRAKKIDEKVMIGKAALQSIFCYHRFCVWRWLIDWRFWVKIFIKWNLRETFSSLVYKTAIFSSFFLNN